MLLEVVKSIKIESGQKIFQGLSSVCKSAGAKSSIIIVLHNFAQLNSIGNQRQCSSN